MLVRAIVKFLSVLLFFTNSNKLCYHPSQLISCFMQSVKGVSKQSKLTPCIYNINILSFRHFYTKLYLLYIAWLSVIPIINF